MGVVCISYAIIMLGNFITRRACISILGMKMSGIEDSFSNIVNVLTMIELGLSAGITYKLYKPIAEKNWDKVSSILNFLKRSYITISAIVLAMGLATSLFVGKIENLKKENFSGAWLSGIFVLYIFDILASYLFCHKRAMFIADQRFYVNKIVYTLCQILMFGAQVTALYAFRSLELFLICKIFFRAIESLVISWLFHRKYNYINLKTKETIPADEKRELFTNIKALLFHKISGVCLDPAVRFMVLSCVDLGTNAIYGNYMKIALALTSVTNEIFSSLTASFGNLLATSGKDRAYKNFKSLYLLNFFIYSFFTTAFFNIITPFMNVWIPEQNAVFGMHTTLALSIYIFIYGMKQSATMAKMSRGIYDPDKYLAVVGILISFFSSYLLVKPFGITGVLIGYMIGSLSVPYWCQPYLVYSRIFQRSVKSYHIKFLLYASLTAVYMCVCYLICRRFTFDNNFLQILFNAFVCFIIPGLFNLIFFFKTEEFNGLKNAIFKKK